MSIDGVKWSYSSTIGLPRVVDAKIKPSKCVNHEICTEKSRISGDLYIVESCNLHLRYAQVRDGNLLLYRYVGQIKEFDIRIPLYNLSINLDFSRQNGRFSLTKYSDLTPLATFQVVNQGDCEQWLKALAVEIIRQTPLNILKFLDILFIEDILQKPIQRSTRSPSPKKNPNNDLYSSYSLCKHESSKANVYDSDLNKMAHSIDSLDSGFHSLPPANTRSYSPPTSHPKYIQPQDFAEIRQKFETRSTKPKSKLSRSDSIKASVSSSCLNLINKIRTLNPKENHSSLSKTKHLKNDKVKEQKSKWYEKTESQIDKAVSDVTERLSVSRLMTRPRSCDGSINSSEDILADEEYAERFSRLQSSQKPSVTFEIPEEVLQNEELHVLLRLLTKCQIDKQYVPVREKRLLFESLNRFSFSVDNLKRRRSRDGTNLTRSLSLSMLCEKQTPVKAIRDYFEGLKNETPDRVTR